MFFRLKFGIQFLECDGQLASNVGIATASLDKRMEQQKTGSSRCECVAKLPVRTNWAN
jgi:hypothetical protein